VATAVAILPLGATAPALANHEVPAGARAALSFVDMVWVVGVMMVILPAVQKRRERTEQHHDEDGPGT